MPFLDTNSHLKTKPLNFDLKFQCYDRYECFGTMFKGGNIFKEKNLRKKNLKIARTMFKMYGLFHFKLLRSYQS